MSLRTRPLTTLLAAFALVGAYLAVSLALAGPAAAAGTVTVTIEGKGTVTASGISCSESGGDCSQAYSNVIVCPRPAGSGGDAPPIGCDSNPPEVALTAAPDRDGYVFDHFEGCDSTSGRQCDIVVEQSLGVTAVFLDKTAPAVTLTNPVNGAVVGATMALGTTASDNDHVNHVAYFVNGLQVASSSFAPFYATASTFSIANGPAQVQAKAYDDAGNLTASAVHSVTIDHSAPNLAISGPSGQTFGPHSTQTWEFTVTDTTTVITKCSVTLTSANADWGSCSAAAGHSVSNLPEGSYRFSVQALDQASNFTSASRTFTVDATPPDTTLTSGPASGSLVAARSVTFGVGTDDASAAVGCRLYGSGTTAPAFAPCTTATSFTASGLDDGSYVFEARAVDGVGNADASPASRTFTVDTTAPTLSVAKQPKHKVKTRKRKVRVAFAFATEPGATLRCTLDGKAVGCSASSSFKVKAGKHTLTVQAVDAAGNSSQTAAVSWKVKRVHKHH